MSISDQITRLNNAKAAIKQAISNKGVEVSDEAKLDEYPALIDSIKTDEFLAMRTLNHTNYYRLFSDYAGDSLDAFYIEQWDTSNVTDMAHMFSGCINLTIVDLSSFDTSKVITMGSMFNSCSNLETVDIRNFNLSRAQSYGGMFYNCNNLHTLRLDNCNNDTINKIINSSLFPTGAIDGVTRKIYVNPENIDGLEAPEGWIFVDSDGNEIVFGPKLYVQGEFRENWEITEVNTLVTKEHTDLSYMFYNCENLKTINGIEQWDTSLVTNMGSMFTGCIRLERLDLSHFIMDSVENMSDMFEGCDFLRSLRLDNLDNLKYKYINMIINSSGFPTGMVNINGEDIPRLMYVYESSTINPDNKDERLTAPDGWMFVYVATESSTTYNSDFKDFREDRDITEVNTLVTSEHTSLNEMFYNCENLVVIHNMGMWDTSRVVDMRSMFAGCRKLIELDLYSFNTDDVIELESMFNDCERLEVLDIRNFNLGNVWNANEMFNYCRSLHTLRLDNCDRDTIEKIINSSNFPTGDINGGKRKMYVNPNNIEGLEIPYGWEFVYVSGDKE